MSRESWFLIKNNKNFNVHIYRHGLLLLIISLILSCIIGVLMFYKYTHWPERDYYATSGEAPPVKLKSMPEKNTSSTPMLESDPPTENVQKLIPQ